MTSESNTCEHDDTWRQIDAMIDRVADLSHSNLSERDFYHALLQEATRAGAAAGGAVWLAESKGVFQRIVQSPADDPLSANGNEPAASRQSLLARVQETGSPDSVTIRIEREDKSTTTMPVVACPIAVEERVIRILEIVQRADSSPAARQGYLEVLSSFCELAADFHRRVQFQRLRERDAEWERMDQFCQEIHRELHLDATAYTVANEAKRLVECDRVTVAVGPGDQHRVRAVSGLDTFDRRATSIRLLERLVDRVAAVGEPLWYGGDSASLPPEIDAAIQQYVDASHCRTVIAMPLRTSLEDGDDHDSPSTVGVLVFETFDSRPPRDSDRRRIGAVCRHATSALRNAAVYDRLPAVRALEYLSRFRQGRTWVRLAGWTAPVLLIAAVLILVPADFYIRSDGRLRPEQQRRIFAPRDGQVEQLQVQHGQLIDTDTVVATMRSSELDFEITRVLGDLQTTTKQYDAIQASRLGANPTDATQRDQYARLTAEEERLGKRITNLEEQRELLEDQREQLQIRSPIAGQVVTWDVEDRLQHRPVQRGQVLLTVADVHGPWILELQVPDRYVNYVLDAQEKIRTDLDVTFMLATEPEASHFGHLDRFAVALEPNDAQQLSATAWVRLERNTLADPRPGAGVTARIYCGRRSIGYVWLHDLIAAVRAKFFL